MKIAWTFLFASLCLNAWAQRSEGRGEHKTKVVCASVKTLADARKCFKTVGAKMPNENGSAVNSVLVSDKAAVRANLSKYFKDSPAEVKKVAKANYVALVVQQDDEESLYYYVLSNGQNVKPVLVGDTLNLVDVDSSDELMCPNAESTTGELFTKSLIMGMDPKKDLVAGYSDFYNYCE